MVPIITDGAYYLETSPKNSPNKGWAKQNGLDSNLLRTLYEEMTDKEIAIRYAVSDALISYYRRKWGIQTKTTRQRVDKSRVGQPTLDDLTPVTLADLYAQMGDRQVAKLYGVQKPAITRLRQKWGISALSKGDRSANQSTGFTEVQKEACVGTLLGDGHLLERGVLKVTHSQAQLPYLMRLHAFLAPHVLPIFYEEKDMVESGQVAYAFGFRTVQHPWLATLRGLFYPEGRKVFPEAVLSALSPRSLAYWYWDDGHLDSGLPSFALGNITESEANRVAQLVGERFSLDTYVKPQSTETCKLLGIRARTADVLFYLIREFATVDLLYKMPQKHWPPGMVPKVLPLTKEAHALPAPLVERCSGWGSLSEDQRATLLTDLEQHWHTIGFPHPEPRPEEIGVIHALNHTQVIQDGVVKNRQVGQATCHAFAPHIWKARSYGASSSPDDIFQDPTLLQQAFKLCLNGGGIPNGARLRGVLRLLRRSGVYNFRPSAAKALTDRYCRVGGTVWDPCAGYGGRLLGVALSSALPHYIACEPQSETYTRLHHLRDWVDSYVPGVASRVSLHNVPAEEFDVPTGVDMVLTSPPYWKRETYGNEPTQSGIRYPTYAAWLEGFWRVVLTKSVQALRPGGWLVLNVDNFKIGGQEYGLVGDTTLLVRGFGFGEPDVLRYAMPAPGDSDNAEYVLCWPKAGVSSQAVPVEPINVSSCSGCGKPTPFSQLLGGECSRCRTLKGVTVVCEGCGKPFVSLRSGTRFHNEACYARFKRRKYREANPAKTSRTFTCVTCESTWETDLHGNFHTCPTCREAAEVAGRTKICVYRHCGKSFVDTSPKNGMKFCAPECGRREKMFRCGKAMDESYFRVRA
jgi:hypothetical protein